MKMLVIYGRTDKHGYMRRTGSEKKNLTHYQAIAESKLEDVAAVIAQETMRAQMAYVDGKVTQV
jgi:hypothetical protein